MQWPDSISTRDGVLREAEKFLSSQVGSYKSRRNYVSPDLHEVSRLSPAVRHRLITEYELAQMAADRAGEAETLKFRQEVYWRLYWKGYLEQRPEIWDDYNSELATFSDEILNRAMEIEQGQSGVAVMDFFARQLIDTGYLHNHARMWFAAFWIHTLKLPWQLGARFFLRHLLDGDAASNTLSWRWVAGLHTSGKNYLVRRSNIEKYLDPEILNANREGIEALDDERAEAYPSALEVYEQTPIERLPHDLSGVHEDYALWLHDDDFGIETGPLAGAQPMAVFTTKTDKHSELVNRYKSKVAGVTALRAEQWYHCESQTGEVEDLVRWIEEKKLRNLVYLQPFVGYSRDAFLPVAEKLRGAGISLHPLRREEDTKVLPLATGGFFGFWKKLQK